MNDLKNNWTINNEKKNQIMSKKKPLSRYQISKSDKLENNKYEFFDKKLSLEQEN
jgi:uncharacterized ubiquitin-like protein YukD